MFRLKIYTDNAAFADGDVGSELHRILHKLGGDIRIAVDESTTSATFPLFDTNGNKVGEAKYDA